MITLSEFVQQLHLSSNYLLINVGNDKWMVEYLRTKSIFKFIKTLGFCSFIPPVEFRALSHTVNPSSTRLPINVEPAAKGINYRSQSWIMFIKDVWNAINLTSQIYKTISCEGDYFWPTTHGTLQNQVVIPPKFSFTGESTKS